MRMKREEEEEEKEKGPEECGRKRRREKGKNSVEGGEIEGTREVWKEGK